MPRNACDASAEIIESMRVCSASEPESASVKAPTTVSRVLSFLPAKTIEACTVSFIRPVFKKIRSGWWNFV
jgi:hypothetical protein